MIRKIIFTDYFSEFIHQVAIKFRYWKALQKKCFQSDIILRHYVKMPPIKFWERLTKFMISISLSEKFCSQNLMLCMRALCARRASRVSIYIYLCLIMFYLCQRNVSSTSVYIQWITFLHLLHHTNITADRLYYYSRGSASCQSSIREFFLLNILSILYVCIIIWQISLQGFFFSGYRHVFLRLL